MSGHDLALFASVFAAAGVEAVESLTVVLALGITRGWRAPLLGVGAALVVLSALTAALGAALSTVDIDTLRLIVGAFALMFGLSWLRKAVLRRAGRKAMHDEAAEFRRESEAAGSEPSPGRALDVYSLAIAFKVTVLEGMEVALVIISFGSGARSMGLAVLAGICGVVAVAAVGAFARHPLARVPENDLKLGVGVMLTSFGAFWAGEGAGFEWPGGNAALVPLIALVLGASLATAKALSGRPAATPSSSPLR